MRGGSSSSGKRRMNGWTQVYSIDFEGDQTITLLENVCYLKIM